MAKVQQVRIVEYCKREERKYSMSKSTLSIITFLIILEFTLITIQQDEPPFDVIDIDVEMLNVDCPENKTLKRRYDLNDFGYGDLFHGWTDVQGRGAANDYCRFVVVDPKIYLSCALAGTTGESEDNYISAKSNFESGYPGTWYMKDEDNDGRDDYCRCLGDDEDGYQVICTKAGPKGFFGSVDQGGSSRTFTTTGKTNCKDRRVRPEFGRDSGFTL